MQKAKVIFKELIQDSQEYGSDNEHMVSRVYFDLTIDGKEYKGLYADLKQSVGADIESAPIEIGMPQGYSGKRFNWSLFRDEAEKYFRECIGQRGMAIRFSSNAKGIRMYNNRISRLKEVHLELPD